MNSRARAPSADQRALEQRTDFYARIEVAPEHERLRRRKLAGTYVKRAREHNRLGERAAAVRTLLRAPAALLPRARGRAGTTPSAQG